MTQRQTEKMDRSEWASEHKEDKDPCLEDFEHFMNKLHTLYGDSYTHLNSETKATQQYQQLPNELVPVYANRLKANWGCTGENLITHKVVQYDMARVGLRHPYSASRVHSHFREPCVFSMFDMGAGTFAYFPMNLR